MSYSISESYLSIQQHVFHLVSGFSSVNHVTSLLSPSRETRSYCLRPQSHKMEDDSSEAAESVTSVKPPQGFQIQFEKTLPNPARPGLAAWSPKHDLLCFVSTNENVLLYRMNGQRVWGVAQRKENAGQEGQVESLQWRPDG